MPKLYLYGGIALFVLLAVAIIYHEGKSTGETKTVAKQEKVNHAARARKESVKPADSRVTVERLRSGTF